MKLLLLILLSAHLLLIPVVSSSLKQCRFPAIFNFGDSNSDTGGLPAAFGPLNPPYGETFFKEPVGRYSDGRLVIDFIAESFGLPFLSSYLDSLGSNFSHGASFAATASTIVPQNLSLMAGGYSPFYLGVQLSQFLRLMSGSNVIVRQRGGVFKSLMPEKEFFSRALYTIDIGQNDLTALFEQNIASDAYIPNALQMLSTHIQRLYENGGRYFWIHNTGPLGCLPYALLRAPKTAPQMDSAGCSIFFNELAQKYNRMLNETVASLRKEFPQATLILVDMYSVKYSLFANASKFGFEEPLKSCCGYGGGDYNFNFTVRCGYPVMVNGTQLVASACGRPQKRVIWDGIHYTDAANEFVFHQISTGRFSDPPLALKDACKPRRNL